MINDNATFTIQSVYKSVECKLCELAKTLALNVLSGTLKALTQEVSENVAWSDHLQSS